MRQPDKNRFNSQADTGEAATKIKKKNKLYKEVNLNVGL